MTQIADHLNPGNLSGYIDGELPSADSQAVRRHIAECHVCALKVVSAMQLKTATARAGQRFATPPETLARLTAQISQEQPPKIARIFRPYRIVGRAGGVPAIGSIAGWLAAKSSGRYSFGGIARPAPGYVVQRFRSAGDLDRPSHGKAVVPRQAAVQL